MRRILLSLFLVACGSTNEAQTNNPQPTEDAGGETSTESIAWTPCDLFSEGGGPKAECAHVNVPLRATEPNGETLEVFVKRYRPGGVTHDRAAFMLQGGPGASGYVFEKYVAGLKADVDWYLPDHRGTGRSSRLGCPVQEGEKSGAGAYILPNEWKNCLAAIQAEWGDKLAAFTTTNAANDIGVLVDFAKREHKSVFVYGVSYGTYWANRYLQLYPKQAAGVVLDSIAPPGISLARQDEDADAAGKSIFEFCAKDTACATHLGDDPWARAHEVFAKLDGGHCNAAAPEGIPLRVALRRAFGQMAMGYTLRAFIPATIHRVDRCNESDVAALKKLLGKFYNDAPQGEFFKQYSFPLANNISFSELWEDPSPTAADLAAIRDKAIVSRDVTDGFGSLIGKWPTYARDKYAGGLAETDVPMLLMLSPIDPATLYSKAAGARAHFNKPNQYYVELANGGHSQISSTPTKNKTICGTSVLLSFLAAPEKAPDTSCVSDLSAGHLRGWPEVISDLFGTTSMWD